MVIFTEPNHCVSNRSHARELLPYQTLQLINSVLQHGSTPFHWAATNCHLEVMHALLKANADINAVDQVEYTMNFILCG